MKLAAGINWAFWRYDYLRIHRLKRSQKVLDVILRVMLYGVDLFSRFYSAQTFFEATIVALATAAQMTCYSILYASIYYIHLYPVHHFENPCSWRNSEVECSGFLDASGFDFKKAQMSIVWLKEKDAAAWGGPGRDCRVDRSARDREHREGRGAGRGPINN